MKKRLINNASISMLVMCGLLSACSTVKDLTNVDLANVKVWPFGKEEAPRVYQPANSTPYMCEGNKKFFVRVLDKGESVWLILPDREVLLAKAGTSKVYTNGISKLDLSSDDVMLVVNETTKFVACKANGVAKVTKLEPSPVVEPVPVAAPVIAPAPAPQVAEVKAEPVVVPVVNENVEKVVEPVDEKSMSQEGVAKSLDAWANAWRTKNTDAYLNAYSAKFKPEGMSKKTWVEQRKQRVGANTADIKLSLENVNIVTDGKNAQVTFDQHYASAKFSDNVVKVLNFENVNGQWLIVKETLKSKK